jgi:hypothetical protein
MRLQATRSVSGQDEPSVATHPASAGLGRVPVRSEIFPVCGESSPSPMVDLQTVPEHGRWYHVRAGRGQRGTGIVNWVGDDPCGVVIAHRRLWLLGS